MKLKNYVFRQTLNVRPLDHLRKNDGGECFAPLAFALLRAEMLQNCGPRPWENPEIEENPRLGTPPKNKFFTLELFDLLLSLTFDTRILKHDVTREKPKCSSPGYPTEVRIKV